MLTFPLVVGCRRSGSTLVRAMCASHPQVAVPPEAPFVAHMLAPMRHTGFESGWFVDALYASEEFQRWRLPRSAVELSFREHPPQSYAEAVRRVYRLWASRQGRHRPMDVTPGNIDHVTALTSLLPESRVVHVVRDGRNVAASLLELGWARHIEDAALHWRRQVRTARRRLHRLPPTRHHELRYESLVESPETELRRACDALDLPFDPVMLEYRRTAAEIVRSARRPHWHRNVTHPLMPRLRDWRRDLPDPAVARFEAVAGDLLTELGYERHTPDRAVRLRLSVQARKLGWRKRLSPQLT